MKPCPFCHLDPGREILAENGLAFAIYDKYPVSPGHTLVLPKRHEADYFRLSEAERAACWDLVQFMQDNLKDSFSPDAFNVGINVGEAAGQTVFHAHIHLIPRYTGDAEDVRGGVRRVVYGKGDYG